MQDVCPSLELGGHMSMPYHNRPGILDVEPGLDPSIVEGL